MKVGISRSDEEEWRQNMIAIWQFQNVTVFTLK